MCKEYRLVLAIKDGELCGWEGNRRPDAKYWQHTARVYMIKVTKLLPNPTLLLSIGPAVNNIIIVSPLNLQLKHDISSTAAGEVASDDDY